MSQGTESALQALEKSKDDSLRLLDQAVQIAKVVYDHATRSYITNDPQNQSTSNSSFREQWLLKWLLKRIAASTDVLRKSQQDESSSRFVLNERTWAFLLYLLEYISSDNLLEILIERRFPQLLLHAGHIFQLHHNAAPTPSRDAQLHIAVDEESVDRPRKRQRREDSLEPDNSSPSTILLAFIGVARQFSILVTHNSKDLQPSNGVAARHSSPAWASSVAEGAETVGCVLEIAGTLSKQSSQESHDLVVATSVQWLSLWYDISIKSTDKKIVDRSFCRSCLAPSLVLLASLRSTYNNTGAKDLEKELERQVARHVVLPVRSTFNKTLSTGWKASRSQITWDHIVPVYHCIRSHLEGVLVTETIMGVHFVSFQNPGFAAEILSIASRLIPIHDLRRRQWEQPWLEAFLLGLLYLAFPKHIPRLVAGLDKTLAAENADLPQHDLEIWPDQLLATVLGQQIVLSSDVAVYLYSSITIRREQLVPVSLLGQLMQINSEIFIPHASNPNFSQCLDSLIKSIDEREIIFPIDYATLVQNVLLPLMRTYARVRELGNFIHLWQTQLQVALPTYESDDDMPDNVSSALVWRDEDLFSEFEFLLKAYTVQNLAQEMLVAVGKELSNIQQRMGPTGDILSRVAILNSVLRARGNDLIISDPFRAGLQDLVVSVINSLMQQTDYEGQRWRLWAILDTIYAIDASFLLVTDLSPLLDSRLPFAKIEDYVAIDKPHDEDQKALLAECLYSFSLVANYGSEGTEISTSAVQKAMKHLSQLLIFYTDSSHSGDLTKTSWWETMTWDGRLSSMTTGRSLLCGYLGVLAKHSQFDKKMLGDSILDGIQSLAYHALKSTKYNPIPGSLAQLSQIIVQSSEETADRSPLEQYAARFAADKDISASEQIGLLPAHGLKKATSELFVTSLADRLSKLFTSTNAPMEASVAALAFLTKIMHDNRAAMGESFRGLLDSGIADWIANLRRDKKVVLSRTSQNSDCTILTVCDVADMFGGVWAQLLRQQTADATFKPGEEIAAWSKQLASKMESDQITPEQLVLLDVMLNSDFSGGQSTSYKKRMSRYRTKYYEALPKTSLLEDDEDLVLELLRRKVGALSELFWRDEHDEQAVQLNLKGWRDDTIKKIWLRKLTVTQTPESAILGSDNIQHASRACDLHPQILMAEEFCHDSRLATETNMTEWVLSPQSDRSDLLPPLLLTKLVSTATDQDIRSNPTLGKTFESMASLELVSKETSLLRVILRLDLSNAVLNLHPGMIGQSTIDTLLSSLSLLTTSEGSQLDRSSDTGMIEHGQGVVSIYDRLLMLVVTLLSRHRRRLNGRSHLFVQLLCNLTRCLFYTPDVKYIYQNPATMKRRNAFRLTLPVWLREGTALPPSSAEKLSRILSSICNPTTASARSAQRSKRKETRSPIQLNDETQKAKRIAAQYMQYLIMEFARCTLDGVISTEARERLIPGLYDVLGSLDKELMRAMNAAMDSSSRAMFKDLYDNWTRFGKWDQT